MGKLESLREAGKFGPGNRGFAVRVIHPESALAQVGKVFKSLAQLPMDRTFRVVYLSPHLDCRAFRRFGEVVMNRISTAVMEESQPFEGKPASESLRAVSYRAGLEAEWDALVARARNGHFMVSRRFLAYHGDRFEDCSLMFYRGDRLLAVMAMNREGSEWVSHRGTPFGGLIAAPELSTLQTFEIFQELSRRMRAAGVAALRYNPVPSIYQQHPFEDDLYILQLNGGYLASMKLAARARLPELTLMQERTRKYLRSIVPRLKVEEGITPREFWHALSDYLARRYGATPTHTVGEILELTTRFPAEIKLVGLRDQKGQLAAGSLVFLMPKVIRLQYSFGASDETAPRGAVLALDHYVVNKYGAGREWLDFGTSMNPVDGELALNLHSQKERHGGRGMRIESWFWNGEITAQL